MKKFPSLCARAALLAACVAVPAALDARHENSLPDTAYAAAQVRDMQAVKKRAEAHPLALDLQKCGLNDIFEPVRKKFEDVLAADKKDGKADVARLRLVEKLFNEGFFNGEIAVAIAQTPKPEKGHEPFDFIAIADINVDEAGLVDIFHKLAMGEKQPLDDPNYIKKSKFQGVTLFEYAEKSQVKDAGTDVPVSEIPVSFGFAVVGKTLVLATAPNVLRDTVDAVKNGGRKDSLASTAVWKRGVANFANADSVFVANLPFATAQLRKYIVAQAKEEGTNMFAVDYVKAYDTFALDTFDSLWVASEAKGDKFVWKVSIPFQAKRGLLSLYTAKVLDVFVPDFIPASVPSWSTQRFDIAEAWKNLDTLLGQALPTLKPILDGQINELKNKEGLDVRGSVLENFGDHLTTISDINAKFDEGARKSGSFKMSPFIYVIDVRDTAKFDSFIDTAVGKLGKSGDEEIFAERVFQGVKIRTIKETLKHESTFPVSYALDSGRLYLAFNAEKLLNQVVAESKSPSKTLAQTPFVRQALKQTPKTADGFGVTSLAASINYCLAVFEIALEDGMKNAGAKDKDLFKTLDFSKRINAAALPWGITSHTELRPNELYGEATLFRIEDK